MPKTFDALDCEASKMLPTDPVCAGVNSLIAHAADNADDDTGRLASLESLLCYEPDAEVRAWFEARGVNY